MIQLRTLGGLDLSRDGRRLDRVLAQPKRTALLAYLAVATPRGFHSRDTLVALLWPESDRRRARSSLRKSLHFLRRHLGKEAVVGRGDELGLAWGRVWCDTAAFDEAAHRGEPRDALEVYRGDLLSGFHVSGAPDFERWLDAERMRLRRAAVRLAWRLAEDMEAAANGIEAAHFARRATAIDPLDEAGLRRLMELLDRLGDRAGALRAYEATVARLERELEIEPCRETRELGARLREGTDSSSGTPPRSPRAARAPDVPPKSVAVAPEATAPGGVPDRADPGPAADTAVSGGHARRWFVGALVPGLLGVMAVAALGTAAWLAGPPGPAATEGGAAAPATRTGALAVLPFENLLSPDDPQAWLAAALHEQVIHELTRLPGLEVISQTSVLRYADSDWPLADVATRLGAEMVLRGSVLRDGRGLRATIRLVDPTTGRVRWSEDFDATLDRDFLDTRSDIALRVAQTFAVALPPRGGARSATDSTDPEAIRAYLRGRYLWKNLGAPPGARASELFRRAVEIDPDFALAWASLAEGWLASAHFGVEPHTAFPRADSAAIQALTRDPDLAEAHIALADARFHYDWNWETAERGFQRGISLKPSHATAHWWYAGLLAARGRFDEAEEQIRRARTLDPLSPIVDAFGARVLYWARRYDEAEQSARRAIELAPNSYYALGILGFIHLQKDEPDRAVVAFRRSVEISDKFLPGLALALARTDRLEEAREIAARLEATATERYVAPYERAVAQIAAGNLEAALELVEHATATRDAELPWVGVDPVYDALRGEPRFQAVLRQMGLETVLRGAVQDSPGRVPIG